MDNLFLTTYICQTSTTTKNIVITVTKHISISYAGVKYIHIYIYIYIYIYTNLAVNAIVRLHHPQSRDSQGQETFLAPSADNQTCN